MDNGRGLWNCQAVLIFFVVFALLMLCFFAFGLALFIDWRGIGSRSAVRNREVATGMRDSGFHADWVLIFGRTRRVGAFLMVLCGIPLLVALIGLVEVLAGVS